MSARRGPLVMAAATAGLAVVLVAHATHPAQHLTLPSSATRSATGNAGSSGSSGSGPTSSGSSSGNTGSSGSSGSGTSGGGGTRSATGALEQYGYGQLSVTVTVSGSRVVGVSVAQLQTAEQYSQEVAQYAIPTLRNEVLSAQSARISSVSGATYTSEAYAYSVQSALDKLHVS